MLQYMPYLTVLVPALLAWDAIRRFVASNKWASRAEYDTLVEDLYHVQDECTRACLGLEGRLPLPGQITDLEYRIKEHGRILTKLGLKGGP